jgi:hypothetical protein
MKIAPSLALQVEILCTESIIIDGFPTLTSTLSKILPQEFVTVKLKVVEEAGVAIGFAQVVQLNPPAGDQA